MDTIIAVYTGTQLTDLSKVIDNQLGCYNDGAKLFYVCYRRYHLLYSSSDQEPVLNLMIYYLYGLTLICMRKSLLKILRRMIILVMLSR
jgi:hypothetical protein